MAVTPKNIERQIESGLIQLLESESFVSSNNIPVRGWNDAEEIEGKQIIVHVLPIRPAIEDENGEAQEWEVEVDFLEDVHQSESDIPSGETNSIYEFLLGFCVGVTKSQITAKLTGLEINGKNNSDSTESYEDRFYNKAGSIKIYVQNAA